MQYILLVGAFLAFAFLAPLKFTVVSLVLLFLVASIVIVAARAIADVQPTYGQALKAVGLSLFFAAIALFTLLSFSSGTGITSFSGFSALAVVGLLLASYVLGFSMALGTTFGASTAIATLSTIASGALLWGARSLLR
ncbi:hypothetical protein [Ramlibacter algicola]|uniref:Uncharacterized protein n=1 Tax=Ramlibacter algicola TaxID=2795217 RepID=A0A934UT96_9BURK|nr:hypothetical protein [Ramlibacter algicola]MBK0394706.1 hypothetical protein [Ramlibacter algicola]